MKAAGRPFHRLAAPSLALSLLLCFSTGVHSADWPQYRGPRHDGISTDRLNKQWSGPVTNAVWLVPLTNCLGSLTVSGGRVFTQTRRLIGGVSSEVCVALNATNGIELWGRAVDLALYPEGGVGFDDGPRSTPTVDGGSVFVLSSYLKLYRLNATNGSVLWQQDLRNLYGGDVIGWQNSASPLLSDGLIFVNANCGVSTLLALRADDGSEAWRSQDEAMTHSTPVPATIHGVRQVLFATQRGMVSVDPLTGEFLWRSDYPFSYGTSIGISPVVDDDLVFIGGAQLYGMGSLVVQASLAEGTWTATRLWYANNPASTWMTPVARQGFLYGPFGIQSFDSVNAQLKCVEMRTGQVKWSVNGFGRGAVVLVDDHLVGLTERGDLVLVKPDAAAYVELGRFNAIPAYNGATNKCWNTPAVCDGRIFVRSTSYVACYDLSVPSLRLDAPERTAPGSFDLAIRTVTGAPLGSNRLAGLEVRTATNLAEALPQWVPLTNTPVLTGGVARIRSLDAAPPPQRFFIVREPE